MKKAKIFCFVSLALLAVPTATSCSKSDDFAILRNAYRKNLIKSIDTSECIEKGPEGLLKELSEETIDGVKTYYFTDIDYTDRGEKEPGDWKVEKHTNKMLKIAVTAAKTHNHRYQDIAVGLTYYWIYHDFRCVNWWFNDLGCGSQLANTALFVYDDLNEHGKIAIRTRVARTSFYYNESLLAHTGSNLFDYVDNTVKSSVLNRDRVEFELAVKRLEDEIRDDGDEGFQKDGSFFQHGKRLYTVGSYGRSVVRLANTMEIIDKTSRHFKLDKLKILTRFILKGISRGTFKGYANYLEAGRECARKDAQFTSNYLLDLEKYLHLHNLPSRHEFKEFISKLKSQRPTFNGITYFNKAKFVAVNLDGLYLSFKGSDPNLISAETVNGENILGLNMTYGTNTCVLDKGNEYYQIAPVWDYSYLPGTTSFQATAKPYEDKDYFTDSDANLELIGLGSQYYNDVSFGIKLPTEKEGDYVYSSRYDKENDVVCLMQRSCHHGENEFTVTCIACEDGMFLMGADIVYRGYYTDDVITDPQMHTTIEQCLYDKDKDELSLSRDGTELIHNNAFYKTYVPKDSGKDPQTITVRGINGKGDDINNHVKGNWNRNSKVDSSAEGDVLLAYISHGDAGVSSDNPASYAYSIQPLSYKDRKTDKEEPREFELINNFNKGKNVQEVKLPADENGNYKAVVVNYDNEIIDYETCKGTKISLQKGECRVI